MEKQVRQSKPRIDLTDKQFTYLTAKYYIKGGKWHCVCKCGNELDVDTRNLNSGHTQSCGCLQREKAQNNTVDMSNFENDTIKVLSRAGSNNSQIALWRCLCKVCGNIFITKGSSIRNGDTKSCGCIRSLNEQRITMMLIKNGNEFCTQYTFGDLKGVNGGALRFDFAIFHNGQLSHLIEYNGKQHYEKPDGSWDKDWKVLLENDKRKIEYCKKHNIELRIIKYDEEYDISRLI